jgi:hypothetical protein
MLSHNAGMFRMKWANSKGLGYEELSNALRLARRNCRGQRGSLNIHCRLLEACLAYTKKNLRILSANLLQRLAVAFKELGIIKPRARILSHGEAQALEMQVQFRRRGVFRWAPRVEKWLNEVGYKLWLGTVQISLMNRYLLNNPVNTSAKG